VSTLQRGVERLVGRLKLDPSYRIAGSYGDRQLAVVLWHRGRQLLRGLPLRIRARGVRGIVFRGRGVVVEHAYALTAGPGLILEDGACVNALSRRGVVLGRNVTLARGATLTCTGVIAALGEGIEIGDRSAVGANAFLGGQGGIRIGDDVIMGPSVRIFSENHEYAALDRPIRAQGERRAAVTIEEDCWIGAGATILAGVTIGRGCVIAAGAVVTASVAPYSVVAGVPARVIKSRRTLQASGEADRPEPLGSPVYPTDARGSPASPAVPVPRAPARRADR
jgi:acetyltransferase-like isoleucine patch superfamily enzyme